MVIPDTLSELVVPIETLRPYERNPRRGNLEAIKESLEAHGQYRPVVARTSGEVLAGNHTLQAALELGWTHLAVTWVDVDDEQAARIVLVDNRTSDLAFYDNAELAGLLQSLPNLVGTGFGGRDLDRLLDELGGGDAERDTEPMAPPVVPKARLGDHWQLGEHRLVCGDATERSVVERLLDGEQLEMVWTDSPYGVAYVGKTADALTIQNDQAGEMLYELLEQSLGLAFEHTRPGGAIYLMCGDVASTGRRAFADAGWELHQVLVWVKSMFVMGRHDYHWQHEAILYGWRPGAAHRWQAGRTETTVVDDELDVMTLDKRQLIALVRKLRNERKTTVLREDKPAKSAVHPTMKPIALVAQHVVNSSRRGEIVFDPFGGSGSTLIACENLRRCCAMIEIDPAYCDVIVDRWQRHTGLTAELERPRRRARATA